MSPSFFGFSCRHYFVIAVYSLRSLFNRFTAGPKRAVLVIVGAAAL